METKIIPVYSGSLVEVSSLRHSLEEGGIKVFVKDNNHAAMVYGFANTTRPSVELFIFQKDVEKARPIVAEFMKLFS